MAMRASDLRLASLTGRLWHRVRCPGDCAIIDWLHQSTGTISLASLCRSCERGSFGNIFYHFFAKLTICQLAFPAKSDELARVTYLSSQGTTLAVLIAPHLLCDPERLLRVDDVALAQHLRISGETGYISPHLAVVVTLLPDVAAEAEHDHR